MPVGTVLGDAGYGDESDFRVGVAELDLRYVLGVRSPAPASGRPGRRRCRPRPGRAAGRPPTRLRRSPEHQPVSVKELALGLPASAWRTVTWREGSQADLDLALRRPAGPPGAPRHPAQRSPGRRSGC